ncbi:UDP-glucosyltransferase, putative [Ricinus communis]|uniref:Glycosyltransferase n=1 Tax=Ricinus communis TaxID=3988 RepID=B9RYD7_RICCO|nr:UDP-glucosyltransferase, putative [Ricinus communis]|eukprot:XP_002518721.1 scopoletin glucosyltransferase [Ricinus communis]
MASASNNHQLHILLFPLMAQGHMLPLLDIARLFSSRGVKITFITTPGNAPRLKRSSQTTQISFKIIKFPSKEAGLPEGLENLDLISDLQTHIKFFNALSLFQEPLEQVLQELHPHGIVSDVFFPWTADAALKYGIPRLIFNGASFFYMCCLANLEEHQPHKKVSSDTEMFSLPGFPDPIKFSRLQLSATLREEQPNLFTEFLASAKEAEKRSFGMIFNSFYDLESGYVDYYRNVLGRRAWHVGPVSLCNRNIEEKSQRGKEASISEDECMKWLDSKKPNSVLYVCFGTVAKFSDCQLLEIALGLEASGQNFIWVVRSEKNEEEKWLPNGYEKKMEGKGLIMRGWAPQVLILEHEAVGGFVTHCGWNSTLEGVSAGMPMVTWPVFADQFFNEKLITDVLKIGVGVGAQKWVAVVGDYVESGKIEKAVKEVMVGEKAVEIRSRAKKIGEMARMATEFGGSSYNDFGALIEELKSYRT